MVLICPIAHLIGADHCCWYMLWSAVQIARTQSSSHPTTADDGSSGQIIKHGLITAISQILAPHPSKLWPCSARQQVPAMQLHTANTHNASPAN